MQVHFSRAVRSLAASCPSNIFPYHVQCAEWLTKIEELCTKRMALYPIWAEHLIPTCNQSVTVLRRKAKTTSLMMLGGTIVGVSDHMAIKLSRFDLCPESNAALRGLRRPARRRRKWSIDPPVP